MPLDPKELAAAGNALVQWFNATATTSRDAERIMSKVTAMLIAKRALTRGPAAITEELDQHSLNLVKDLADALHAEHRRQR